MYLNSYLAQFLVTARKTVFPVIWRTGEIFCIDWMDFCDNVTCLIWIITQIFRPLQALLKEVAAGIFLQCTCICTSSTEEPGVLLHPVRDSTSTASKTPFLTVLKFPGFIVVLAACVVLLPQLFSSFQLLQKKKSFAKPWAKSFRLEQNLAHDFPLNSWLCLSLRLAFMSLGWCYKGTKLYLRRAAFTFTWCQRHFSPANKILWWALLQQGSLQLSPSWKRSWTQKKFQSIETLLSLFVVFLFHIFWLLEASTLWVQPPPRSCDRHMFLPDAFIWACWIWEGMCRGMKFM